MSINEYGNRSNPTVILIAPMMVSGSDLYALMKPYFKGSWHFIAPDQGAPGTDEGDGREIRSEGIEAL